MGRRWGLGPMAQRKKSMIKEGKLDKHGKPNSNTPKDFLDSYKEVNGANIVASLAKETSSVPESTATPIKNSHEESEGSTKKKKKLKEEEVGEHEDGTLDKKAKKEKKKKKKKKKKKVKEEESQMKVE